MSGILVEEGVCALLQESAGVIQATCKQATEIIAAGDLLIRVLQDGGAVLTAGNGGSAAEAMHMAEELTGRFRGNRRSLPGIALNADGTLLTCIANDFGFDAVFSRQVEGLARPGDVLVVFSTSGQSSNVVWAVRAAKAKGVEVIGVLGRDGGLLASMCTVAVVVPCAVTERIQEVHQVLMHIWLHAIEQVFEKGENV